MSTFSRNTESCRYHHDALDRLIDSAFPTSDNLQRFYCKTRLATEIQGPVRYSLFQHDDQVMAQQQHRDGRTAASLLATDRQRSVCNVLDDTETTPIVYTAYGYRPRENGLLSLLGFNGERPDPLTGHYHLGNGYRQFNPLLMRFNSPDSWSPFGKGGLNAYTYCVGDPINRSDPTGHLSVSFLKIAFGTGAVMMIGGVALPFVEDETAQGVIAFIASIGGGIAAGAGLGAFYKLNQLKRAAAQRNGAPRNPLAQPETGWEMREFFNSRRQPWSPDVSDPPPSYGAGVFNSQPLTNSPPGPRSSPSSRSNAIPDLQPDIPFRDYLRSRYSQQNMGTRRSLQDSPITTGNNRRENLFSRTFDMFHTIRRD